ncbi:SITS-binding protein-like [Salminus brasiliensis]|uniref:SITS-binding protein-like n=1 Tax=Salminus brasiliensis TaxID=930266 RepID=UPI003B830B5E
MWALSLRGRAKQLIHTPLMGRAWTPSPSISLQRSQQHVAHSILLLSNTHQLLHRCSRLIHSNHVINARGRKPCPYPEVSWNSELKAEEGDQWKGTAACIAIGFLFVMTLGLIYWQVVDQPHMHWIIQGRFTGLFWDSKRHSLVLQMLSEHRTLVEVSAGRIRDPDLHGHFWRNQCWLNSSSVCTEWERQLKVRMVLESDEASHVECYNITWMPLHCHVEIKHCFSMERVMWYGGASVQAQRWPLNTVTIPLQPFAASDLRHNPSGYGSVLDHQFFGSSGVAVLLSPDVPLNVGIQSNHHFCVQPQRALVTQPLQYRLCLGPNLKVVHQKIAQERSLSSPQLPNLAILRSPIWKLVVNVDSGEKLEKELRTFANRLKRHQLNKGIISLDEHSTSLLLNVDHSPSRGKNRNLPLVRHLNISVTFAPYVSVNDQQFQTSLQKGNEAFWLSRLTTTQGHVVPLTSPWKGDICVKLNVSNPAAVSWFLERVGNWSAQLDAEYVILEGGEGSFSDGLPEVQASQDYIRLLAGLAIRIERTAMLTSGSRTSDVPLFLMMSPLQGSWSYLGIKGIIPSILHYSVLGYNFFISDAIGGSLTDDLIRDEELFIRWLEIVTFLPVMSFQTPPWSFSEYWILNLTKSYLSLHHDFVIPLIIKYAHEWRETRNPIYRPLWWISPEDPITFTIDDEFLIGSEVLVAPVTDEGAVKRDIYLPGVGIQWRDRWNGQVFDGGTLLDNYPVGLEKVAVFLQIQS